MRETLNGIIVLDKPADISSARAVADVKRLLGAAKVGHAGTLDPFATGVLLCCVNQATRLARFFLGGAKRYEARLRLGIETDTQDATGAIVASSEVPALTAASIDAVLHSFRGEQMQHPPVYSALKHQGKPLYKLAREGNPVQKPPRPINISDIRATSVDLPDIRFDVCCSAGTYVRTLCADIGRVLGCGGHLAELRRTAAGGFSVAQSATLQAFRTMSRDDRLRLLVPMDSALRQTPSVLAGAAVLNRITQGQPLTTDLLPPPAPAAGDNPAAERIIKVVDEQSRLRAVLQTAPNGTDYLYCCVFH